MGVSCRVISRNKKTNDQDVEKANKAEGVEDL